MPSSAEALQQRATTWLVISIASSVLCLSLGLGIGGAIFCYLARQAASQGLTADAEAKLKWGQILTLAGSALGVLTTIVALISR
jgi:ABC-type nickel/cobalt efflux system permease component RcnA